MSMRDIKRRMKSVRNIKQITKAMGLVSSTKVQRAKREFENSKPFLSKLDSIAKNFPSDFYSKSCEKKCIVAISSDRGLCGAFNINIIKFTMDLLEFSDKNIFISIGNCGAEIAKRKSVLVDKIFSCSSDIKMINNITELLIDYYKSGYEICLVYTKFYSAMKFLPKEKRILPLAKVKNDFIFEQDYETVSNYFIKKYVSMSILGAIVESNLCEQSSRMLSMNSATENAENIISDLNLKYNRMRQNQITQELTEIISGAEALKN